MKSTVYKINCLTNLHVGNGEVNYSIVDNEVEKDVVTNHPAIYSSSLKGALRQHFELIDDPNVEFIFGSPHNNQNGQMGAYKFFEAHLLVRPLRTTGRKNPYILATCMGLIKQLLSDLRAFGKDADVPANLENALDTLGEGIYVSELQNGTKVEGEVEGESVKPLNFDDECIQWLKNIIGEDFAIMNDDHFARFNLPVLARNQLENGTSKNLWYEEVVPHKSQFYFVVLSPDNANVLSFDQLVQIGGNATIGYGFTQISAL